MVEPWAEEGKVACADADLIIGSAITDLLGASLAEAPGKRFARAYLQPLLPSREMPPVAAPRGRRFPGIVNIALHHLAEQLQWYVLRAAVNGVVRPRLGLAPYPWHGAQSRLAPARHPVICGYSEQVVPRPADWPDHARVTGYWFLDEAEAWQPPAELLSFLSSGPPPIYVGFSRVSSLDPAATTRPVLEALRSTGHRAILATGWGALSMAQDEGGGRVFCLKEAPHDWLFRRVALAVHHGGAGTTAAALRAGIPSVIVPFQGDQNFWGWRLETLGVAPPRLDCKRLTAARLAHAIKAASAPLRRSQARALGARISAENGVGTAIDTLAGWGLLS
jgi:UDP:flavonoid glycosyltransferase YjiC (YdhE family)